MSTAQANAAAPRMNGFWAQERTQTYTATHDRRQEPTPPYEAPSSWVTRLTDKDLEARGDEVPIPVSWRLASDTVQRRQASFSIGGEKLTPWQAYTTFQLQSEQLCFSVKTYLDTAETLQTKGDSEMGA
jgi:hypothetical protein